MTVIFYDLPTVRVWLLPATSFIQLIFADKREKKKTISAKMWRICETVTRITVFAAFLFQVRFADRCQNQSDVDILIDVTMDQPVDAVLHQLDQQQEKSRYNRRNQ